jgi:hypothetical protein
MTELKNRFGWSISRENKFHQCRRCYYFHYYFSWGGWQKTAPSVVREAFKLKRLVSLPLWRGQLVHYIASKFLQSLKIKGRIPAKDDVINYTMERFDNQFQFSRRKDYLNTPKKTGGRLNIDWLALRDHEYSEDIERSSLERTRWECVKSIEGLYESPLLEIIVKTNSENWEIEDLDHAQFSQSFRYHGVDVYAKTDFTFLGEDSCFNIVDWKTSHNSDNSTEPIATEPSTSEQSSTEPSTTEPNTSEPNSTESGETDGAAIQPSETLGAAVQLGVYGYYASRVKGIEPGNIRLLEVNLLEGGMVKEHLINSGKIEGFGEYIEKSVSELASVLVNGDTDRNEPLGINNFPQIESRLCNYCNFYRICKDPTNRISL